MSIIPRRMQKWTVAHVRLKKLRRRVKRKHVPMSSVHAMNKHVR